MTTEVKAFFDQSTYTLTYVVFDKETKDAIIIDPVLDYDPNASKISFDSLDLILHFTSSNNLNIHCVLETHAHADHITSAREIKKRLPHVKIGIGKNITKVQKVFSEIYNLKNFNCQGEQFDFLLEDNEIKEWGSLKMQTIFTPGHTPACCSYLIEDMLFVGDALFMPDYGTGRCDFPLGSASDLYNSIHERIYNLPDDTKVFVGHDYQPGGRDLAYQTTVGQCKLENIQLKKSTLEKEFIEFRNSRDKTLNAPRLLLPSVQVNINAGKLPDAEDNGSRYLKIPLN